MIIRVSPRIIIQHAVSLFLWWDIIGTILLIQQRLLVVCLVVRYGGILRGWESVRMQMWYDSSWSSIGSSVK